MGSSPLGLGVTLTLANQEAEADAEVQAPGAAVTTVPGQLASPGAVLVLLPPSPSPAPASGPSPAPGPAPSPAMPPPGQVGNLVSTGATYDSISLSWTAPANGTVSAYAIEYSLSGANAWTLISPPVTGTTVATTIDATISGLTQQTPYDIQVFALGTNGAPGPTASLQGIQTQAAPPGPVTSADARKTELHHEIHLSWSAPLADATHGLAQSYMFQSRPEPSAPIPNTPNTKTTVKGLSPGTTYTFLIVAANSSGLSNPVSVTGTTATDPGESQTQREGRHHQTGEAAAAEQKKRN
ncbi:fibronectin type III domain-containing protein [Paraburkholderia sediminicola]|uniref:fibronectin type III domain-containing protein n=1 Tax=Paraburkholderia sediminicola TaxID=458836 RepID=UPI0038B9CC78